MVALQTTEAVVPGSYPASFTVENSEDRQSHCVYCKISGQRGTPPPEANKRKKKKKRIYICFYDTIPFNACPTVLRNGC